MSELNKVIKIEQFDGPFHVLVEMLESQKLEITEVSLSQVTEQYLQAINQQPNSPAGEAGIDPYALADFLVVSSRLLFLKSKLLLPMLDWGDDEEEIDLAARLKMYKEYYDAAQVIEQILRKKKFAFTRERLAVDVEVIFNPPHNLSTMKMKAVMAKVISDIEPIIKIPKKVIRQTLSIRDKINHVRELILARVTSNFSELLQGSKDKTEAIVTFLAMLELVKQRVITVEQEEKYGEITLEKISNSPNSPNF
jgi:segregation and condensation protein A